MEPKDDDRLSFILRAVVDAEACAGDGYLAGLAAGAEWDRQHGSSQESVTRTDIEQENLLISEIISWLGEEVATATDVQARTTMRYVIRQLAARAFRK